MCSLCDIVLYTGKRRERERRGIVVPPPRPAFPRQTGGLSKGQREGTKREEGEERKMKEGDNQREMELWAALEKKEAEEKEKREEGEEEGEKGRGSVERGKTHQAVPTITFRHTAGPDTGPSISVRQLKSHTHTHTHHVNQPYHNSRTSVPVGWRK